MIDASNNYIRSINLELPKLEELWLGNNYIEKVPVLTRLPELQTLELNANKIKNLAMKIKHNNYKNMIKMILSSNVIEFNDDDLKIFVKHLRQFK